MGLDLTLTDDIQPATVINNLGEGLPVPAVAETSNSKTADAIADILGLSTNPYLTSKEDKTQLLPTGDFENAFFDTTFTSTTDSSPSTNTLSLSQPMESLIVSKEELQSIMPSQETLDALKVSPSTLQSLGQCTTETTESRQPVAALSKAASELLNSLPDVTFMISNTLTSQYTHIQK